MLHRIVLSLCVALFGALPLSAGTVEDLSRLLRIDEMLVVMRDEGIAYGADLEDELFPGKGGARWARLVATIYDPAGMRRQFDDVFDPQMAAHPEALDATLDFFGTDRGQRIVALELAARRALLDDAVEKAAQVQVDEMRRADDPRLTLILRFADVNDLIERNVEGALNSNLAFYHGMAAGGAFGEGLSEREILSDVWSQEGEIRAETQDWLYPFLTLAYQPLSDEDMRAYVAYSESGPGQALNAALFAAFDAVFSSLSQNLGRAAAQMLAGEDL